MAKILILGSNFAGVTSALELQRKLKGEHEILVVSPTTNFLYVPSLIWVPFGRRKVKDISFDIEKVLEKKGVHHLKDAAIRILPDSNQVETKKNGLINYDYLVIATGVKMKFDFLDGLLPEDNLIQNIVIPKYAERTAEAFDELVKDPGPVVIGATQGASCMGAAYEFLFNMDKELRKRNVRKKIDLYWITPEPFLGHFGIEGMPGGQTMLETFMKMYNIHWITDASVEKIEKDKLILKNGKELPYKFSMLMPPFLGADVMLNTPELTDDKGFVETNEGYQHIKYKNVFAAGLAVKVIAPFTCESTPFGVPKTGYPSDKMGKIVAKNIIHAIKQDGKFTTEAFGKMPAICIMDAGQKEVYILANRFFKPRQFAIMMPNVLNDWGKVILEKYMIYKNKHGLTYLP